MEFEKEIVALARTGPCGVLSVGGDALPSLTCIDEIAKKCQIAECGAFARIQQVLNVLMERGTLLYYGDTEELQHLVFASPQELANLIP